MIFPVFPWMYAVLFLFLLLTWPFYALASISVVALCSVLLVNTTIFLAVAWFTHSPELSFWRGLRIICSSYSIGCANITILYIIPVLLVYYIRMMWATWMGFRRGKSYTEQWWQRTVSERCS